MTDPDQAPPLGHRAYPLDVGKGRQAAGPAHLRVDPRADPGTPRL